MNIKEDNGFLKKIIKKSITWHDSPIPDLGKFVDGKIMETYGQNILYFLNIIRDKISDSRENLSKAIMEE